MASSLKTNSFPLVLKPWTSRMYSMLTVCSVDEICSTVAKASPFKCLSSHVSDGRCCLIGLKRIGGDKGNSRLSGGSMSQLHNKSMVIS